MKLLPAFPFKNNSNKEEDHHHSTASIITKQPWQWPSSCKNPKTLSFRAGDEIFKTVNSVFFDPSDGVETPESWFTNSSESGSFSTESEDHFGDQSVETIIQGVRSSGRLFFEPGCGDTSSILDAPPPLPPQECDDDGNADVVPYKESVAVAMESEDPYEDFKRSMEEMVERHGLKEWECLEELLGWYLKMNVKMNHGFIIGAFVDLLLGLLHQASTSGSTTSFSSAASSFSSLISSSSAAAAPILTQTQIMP